jgi:uncharacterized repeat protein (TIGR03803 family)
MVNVSTSTPTVTYLTSFAGIDGAEPTAGVVADHAGNFYGTCSLGGIYDNGTVFKISAAGKRTNLHEFSSLDAAGINSDGANPKAALIIGQDGDLYGTTQHGGMYGSGTVFKIKPSGALTTLYNFGALQKGNLNADGANPIAALVEGNINGTAGNFYGATNAGGTSGYGTLFQITPGGVLTTLHTFTSGDEGALPYAPLIQSQADGYLYGTTSSGGVFGQGTVFCLDPQTPRLISLRPSSAKVGSASFTLTAMGTGYIPTSTVYWGNIPLATTYVTSSQVTAVVPADLLTHLYKATVTVVNTATGSSNVMPFTVR